MKTSENNKNNQSLVVVSNENPVIDSIIRDNKGYESTKEVHFESDVIGDKLLRSILIGDSNESQKVISINIDDIQIPNLLTTIYDYSNREDEITKLEKSIEKYGQLQPILIVKNENGYTLIDGYLRIKSLKNLEINEVSCVLSNIIPLGEDGLGDLIINNKIQKEKRVGEKMNEVKFLLRIGMEHKNPNRDKNERILSISRLLGKGFDRNNVYYLDEIINWEFKNTQFSFDMSTLIVNNDLKVGTGIEVINIINEYGLTPEMKGKIGIVEKLISGQINPNKCRSLLIDFDKKMNVDWTKIDIKNIESDNYQIIEGSIEEIELPTELKIDVLLTSIPYYQLKVYGKDSREIGWEKTPQDYVDRITNIILKCSKNVKDTGSLFINIGETYDDGQCLGIIDRLTVKLMDSGLLLIDKLIWNKKLSGKPVNNNTKRLLPNYEVILHLSKTKNFHFEKIKLPKKGEMVISRTCGEEGCEPSFYIPNNYSQVRSVLEENEIEKIDGFSHFSNVIQLTIGKNRTKFQDDEKVHHGTFPSTLGLIPILSCCPKNPESVVFDPFSGTGTTGLTSLSLGFKYVGCELYPEYVEKSKKVLYELEQTIKNQPKSTNIVEVVESVVCQ